MPEGLHHEFIPPGVHLDALGPDNRQWRDVPVEHLRERWNTPEGQHILQQWQASNYDRSIVNTLVGSYCGRADMRGVPLDGLTLVRRDLSFLDLAGASLEGTNLYGANLKDSWLTRANIRGANFSFAKLDDAVLDAVDFNRQTRFTGVNLNSINFTLAVQLHDLAVSQQRIADLEERSPRIAFLMRITSDYGRSFSRFFFWAGGVIACFAMLHWAAGSLSKPGLPEALYFSVVTFTTLGYGDIHPVSPIGMLLSGIEAILGVFMIGLLVALISRRAIGY